MSKQKIEKATTVFLVNNDPERIWLSLHQVYNMAMQSDKEIPPKTRSEITCDMIEIQFLLKALASVRSKVVSKFQAKITAKNRKKEMKKIRSMYKTLYNE